MEAQFWSVKMSPPSEPIVPLIFRKHHRLPLPYELCQYDCEACPAYYECWCSNSFMISWHSYILNETCLSSLRYDSVRYASRREDLAFLRQISFWAGSTLHLMPRECTHARGFYSVPNCRCRSLLDNVKGCNKFMRIVLVCNIWIFHHSFNLSLLKALHSNPCTQCTFNFTRLCSDVLHTPAFVCTTSSPLLGRRVSEIGIQVSIQTQSREKATCHFALGCASQGCNLSADARWGWRLFAVFPSFLAAERTEGLHWDDVHKIVGYIHERTGHSVQRRAQLTKVPLFWGSEVPLGVHFLYLKSSENWQWLVSVYKHASAG